MFKTITYYKNVFSDTNKFPGESVLCSHPFFYAEIRLNGEVHVCCPSWNPTPIGNVLTDNFENIWNGENAQIVRNSILDGSYSYCNKNICPRILNWKNDLYVNNIIRRNQLVNSVKSTPERILFVVDLSCNLSCPSCRKSKITQIDKNQREQALKIIRGVLSTMFSKPHNEHKFVGMDGSGEIFSSEVYRELFETEEIFTHTYKWPNLRFNFSTNGTLMTEKNQKKYKNLMEKISRIDISIDAGNQRSYDLVRRGGNWDLLWKNIDYFYSTIKDKKETTWIWNVIVQKNNFESIPELIDLANKYTEHKPILRFSRVLNWGAWTNQEYSEQAVHLPDHPLHNRYLEIMNLPKVKKYKSDNNE